MSSWNYLLELLTANEYPTTKVIWKGMNTFWKSQHGTSLSSKKDWVEVWTPMSCKNKTSEHDKQSNFKPLAALFDNILSIIILEL